VSETRYITRYISGKAPIEQNRFVFPHRAEVASTPHRGRTAKTKR